MPKKEPVRRPLEDGECYTLEKHSIVTPQLSIIDDIIKDQKEYIPIFLSDYPQISALSKLKRYKLFEVLKAGHLSRPVVYFKYTPYSGIATSHFVWVLPDDTMYAKNTADISSQIPVFHTRAMQSEFKDHFTSVCKLTPTIYRDMYRYLSGDASANPNKISKETDERLKLALTSGDPSMVYDLRELNLGSHAKYDDFWDGVHKVLERDFPAASEERRHGNELFLSVAVSTKDLTRKVLELKPGIDIPSESWILLQFTPKSQLAHASINSRFNIVYKIQSSTHHCKHEDTTAWHFSRSFAHFLLNIESLQTSFAKMINTACMLLNQISLEPHYYEVGEL